MNSELCRLAQAKVGNSNVLVNIISRRVRQLNSGGASGRPLIPDSAGLGVTDIALREVIEEKLGWKLEDPLTAPEPAPRKRRKSG